MYLDSIFASFCMVKLNKAQLDKTYTERSNACACLHSTPTSTSSFTVVTKYPIRSNPKGRGILNWKAQDQELLVTWQPSSGSRGRNAGAQLTFSFRFSQDPVHSSVLHTFVMGFFPRFLCCMPSDRSSGICFHGDFKSSWADGEGEGALYGV